MQHYYEACSNASIIMRRRVTAAQIFTEGLISVKTPIISFADLNNTFRSLIINWTL